MNQLPENHPFYFPENITLALEEIKRSDFSRQTFAQVIDFIRGHLQSIPILEMTLPAGTVLARARTKENPTPYERLSEITLRDKKDVKSLGRAHIPNQSIFYCSTDPEVAIREATQWHVTDFGALISRNMLGSYNPHVRFVTVSIWRVTKDIKVASLFLNKTAIEANPVVKYFGEKVLNDQTKYDERIRRSKNLILEFFSDQFAKKEIKTASDYLLSAYYANEIYIMSHITGRIDGVSYPTVALDYKGENIAITEIAYMNKLEFVTAYHNYVANIEFNGRPMAIGEILEVVDRHDDVLVWKDIPTGQILPYRR